MITSNYTQANFARRLNIKVLHRQKIIKYSSNLSNKSVLNYIKLDAKKLYKILINKNSENNY